MKSFAGSNFHYGTLKGDRAGTGQGHKSKRNHFSIPLSDKNMTTLKICVLSLFLFIFCASGQNIPSFETWNGMALSAPRSNVLALTVKNYAIFAGGFDENGTASDVVDVLDVSTRKLSTTNLSVPRIRVQAAANESHAVFAEDFKFSRTSRLFGLRTWMFWMLIQCSGRTLGFRKTLAKIPD